MPENRSYMGITVHILDVTSSRRYIVLLLESRYNTCKKTKSSPNRSTPMYPTIHLPYPPNHDVA
jgi:hypothetical protein